MAATLWDSGYEKGQAQTEQIKADAKTRKQRAQQQAGAARQSKSASQNPGNTGGAHQLSNNGDVGGQTRGVGTRG